MKFIACQAAVQFVATDFLRSAASQTSFEECVGNACEKMIIDWSESGA